MIDQVNLKYIITPIYKRMDILESGCVYDCHESMSTYYIFKLGHRVNKSRNVSQLASVTRGLFLQLHNQQTYIKLTNEKMNSHHQVITYSVVTVL